MADNLGGESTSPPGIRRAATDPARSSVAMNERPSQDREAPRVRFSQDLDRATAVAYTLERPGTPDLTIDTEPTPASSNEASKPAGSISAMKVSNPSSPTSPRTRDRGYSLRRSLFARAISGRSEDSPI